MRKPYGTLVRVKLEIYTYGSWEKYSTHIIRLWTELDIGVLQATLHHYQTMIEYIYQTILSIEEES